ncbi:hypothetical protein ACFRCG_39735 [Embleya sp. NPDC056575]|uniref:hypothetical protein n=1 Tax=unclassified Embleya TaxID=2699296 RepID=UPI0036A98C66
MTSLDPPTVCLCGSLRHWPAILAEAARQSRAGWLVDMPIPDVGHDIAGPLHLARIRRCDRVVVVGEPGEHTRAEVAYAESLGRPVSYTAVLDEAAAR